MSDGVSAIAKHAPSKRQIVKGISVSDGVSAIAKHSPSKREIAQEDLDDLD